MVFWTISLRLKWIKQNIANFGGDPNNVTVSGQSCGAQSATAEILSPLAKGLFNKAILESGPLLTRRTAR